MKRYTKFEHETEIKLETSIPQEVRDAIFAFLQTQGVQIKTILQWDIASRKVEDASKDKGFRLDVSPQNLPKKLQDKVEKLFPRFSSGSRLRIRSSQIGENKYWALEEKDKEPYFEFILQDLKDSLKEKSETLSVLIAALSKKQSFLSSLRSSVLKKSKKKKSKKSYELIRTEEEEIKTLQNLISTKEEEIRLLKTKIEDCKVKKDLSASENEYSFWLSDESAQALGYTSLEEFLAEMSKKGTITGVVHKTRYHLESLEPIRAILGENSGCTEVTLDLGITPVDDGKFLTRLEFEFDTMQQLDAFFDVLDGALVAMNALFAETGMRFDKKALKKGQRTLSFEQYPAFPQDDARKTPLQYFQSLRT